jgi:hypothetical protein
MRTNVLVLAALAAAVGGGYGCANGAPPIAGFFGGPSGTTGPGFGGSSSGGSEFPQPSFGATTQAATAPRPLSGGTLIVLKDGHTAVAADSDHDVVYVVDTAASKVLQTIALTAGDEPGRLAEDGAGRVHVALRGGSSLVTLDPASGTILARRMACPAPRGVAWDPTRDAVWVACATGELLAFPSAGGPPTTNVVVERDLRDVVVIDGALTVSTFRHANLLSVAADGTVARRSTLPSTQSLGGAQVLWRTVAGAQGTTVAVYQTESSAPIPTSMPGGYGGDGSGPPVETTVASLGPTGVQSYGSIFMAVVPVDVALSREGTTVAVVAAGNALDSLPSVMFADAATMAEMGAASTDGVRQAVAVAFDGSGRAVVQTRAPARLDVVTTTGDVVSTTILDSRADSDTGFDVFHTVAGAPIACASCHPEGGDDGHTWILDGEPRRTPSLRGTIAGTAPYHWPGDQPTFTDLANDVYSSRMSGQTLQPDQLGALEHWVGSIPRPAPPSWVDQAAASRGKALFASAEVGCSGCHVGDKLTNNATMDVGTGGAFQVPPLVGVGWRAPFLHAGCAATLADRFGGCATPVHGNTSQLTPANVSDLVAFLETL